MSKYEVIDVWMQHPTKRHLNHRTALAFAQDSEPNATPSLLLGQGDQLQRIKVGLAAGDPHLVAALKEIVKDADAALR